MKPLMLLFVLAGLLACPVVAGEPNSETPKLLSSDTPVPVQDKNPNAEINAATDAELFSLDGDAPVSSRGCDCDCGCDPQLIADIVESLRYLHTRQEDILERLAKVESAMIKVQKPSGQIVTRSIPIQQGSGEFVLGPGEKLTAVQDVLTGHWVSTSKPVVSTVSVAAPTMTPATTSYIAAPMQAFQTASTVVETSMPVSGPTTGRVYTRVMPRILPRLRDNIRNNVSGRQASRVSAFTGSPVTFGTCRTVNGVTVCN